jgi:prealbumin domain-containing protein
MSFVKLAATTTLVLALILAISMVATAFFSSSIYAKFKDNLLFLFDVERAVGEKQNDIIKISAQNKTSSSSANNQVQGMVIVTKKVINEGGGDKKPSDFTINIHGNDPSPSSFPGNSSGTTVKLHMGMYSITETGSAGYNTSWSDDCSGGMMSSETRKCIITNMYSKTILSNTTNGN